MPELRKWQPWQDLQISQKLLEGAEAMGISLNETQLAQFETYASMLVEWNEKFNLTSITKPEEILEKHFLDSLTGGFVLQDLVNENQPDGDGEDTDNASGSTGTKEPVTLIDIGTGAGFPGIPLKIAFPSIHLTLLDSLQKRVGFLNEVVSALGLEHVTCIHGRAEELAHDAQHREKYDLAASRAVASLDVLLEYSCGYLKEEGLFLAYKGPSLMDELSGAQDMMHKLHMEMTMIHQEISLENDHMLGVFLKTEETPLQYPRKQSKIKKSK